MYEIENRMLFQTVQNVRSFCFEAGNLPKNTCVKVIQEDSIVDGKSILGVLSLDFKKAVKVKFTYNKPIDNNLFKSFNQWIIEE